MAQHFLAEACIASATDADKMAVEYRLDPRHPANLEARVAELTGAQRSGDGLVVEISNSGLKVLVDFPLSIGTFLQLEIGGSRLLAQVIHARLEAQGCTAGLEIEQVLLGGTDVSQMLRGLLEYAATDMEQVPLA